MNDIDIKEKEINEELSKFKKAIEEFKPYSESFIKNTTKKFDGFNSDFINKMEKVLENMSDSRAPELIKKAEQMQIEVKKVLEIFVTVDNESAKQFDDKE